MAERRSQCMGVMTLGPPPCRPVTRKGREVSRSPLSIATPSSDEATLCLDETLLCTVCVGAGNDPITQYPGTTLSGVQPVTTSEFSDALSTTSLSSCPVCLEELAPRDGRAKAECGHCGNQLHLQCLITLQRRVGSSLCSICRMVFDGRSSNLETTVSGVDSSMSSVGVNLDDARLMTAAHL
uniref:RING-type domain-containing protein n=1 Tax=Noctiluca scintillans TaxID=2966 RepID=A0A7S1A9N0_NOCSC|mmetsp:Transcript_37342/g.99296  ORF Transcript_37342/g.99296 Transcript_37342/m.99296 type:complete len:182 (+) Transcript_37342:74-619(+)